MHITRIGRRELNLEYLIMTEDFDDPPRTVVTMLKGKEFAVSGDEAEKLKQEIEETRKKAETPKREPRQGEICDPETGERLSGGAGEQVTGT